MPHRNMLEIVSCEAFYRAHFFHNGSVLVACMSTTIVTLCAESSKEQVARTRRNHTHHKERLNVVGQRNSAIISNPVSVKIKLLNGTVGLVIVCSRARIAHSRHVNGTSPHCDVRVLQRSVADCDGTHIQPGDAVC